MNSLLEFHQVSRRFGRSNALKDASFRVPAGSITALLGPNGAGKSTALKIALNLVRPSSGEARVLGADSRKIGPAELARIGYVAEGMELPDWMTVDQFLGWCRPLYPKWDGDLERELRKQFALPGDRKLKHLSRGQRMKAALISALAYRPELLVLDEPFSGLDPLVRDEFITGLLELAGGEGFSVVLSSHDIEEVDRLADHVVMLNHGKVLLDESTESLLARHRRVEVLLPENFGDLPLLPDTWIAPQSSGRVLRFADTAHETARFQEAAERVFPGCPPPDVQPYSLRELFVTLVRAGKADAGA
ncbi:ABC transporter ATP-binding protein [Luteolibacter luteus]|uniref:ABC transporter ATP-binding protein n=1 Tax=Luteolibacter luteus TaxID=2728835 RepID=A0A858RNS8_9BACT|nr:ABC transporter ATP-binding protein [Luteolibacter luteus]QJE97593.1 ABC transporter ATP-binding protein [Luteolibacter luteus]